jgi:hypothetical protein
MQFGFKTLIAAGILAAGLGTSAASAMPMVGGAVAQQADVTVRADKAAVLCIGSCYRRFGYYRPGFRRGYRAYAYRPFAVVRPFHRYGYYR